MVEHHFALTAFLHGRDSASFETKKPNGSCSETLQNNISTEALRIDG